jgi:hypothetical protein
MVYKVIGEQSTRHPEWSLINHRALCNEPRVVFRRLFQANGLRPTAAVERFLQESTNRPDEGLYSVYRRSADEPDKWKKELTTAQIDTVQATIARFRLPFYLDFA